MGSPAASGGGGGSPNQMSKDKAKDKAKKDAKKTANVEMGLGTDRMSNYTTGQGGTKPDGGEGAGAESALRGVGIVANSGASLRAVTPTIAEVSQATATDATADTIETRKKKTKAKGRSVTILNRAKGISSDEGLTLGKRSLLGS